MKKKKQPNLLSLSPRELHMLEYALESRIIYLKGFFQ